ncbi:PQQ-binding-like beta-propeller repeat protein [Flagellimonas sp.]|uniref:PQQ-binding-like beta-propeller repeat protein n=1 Tax=Flagellimonas sp. TaxID=2058762 RepID=UPI003B51B363
MIWNFPSIFHFPFVALIILFQSSCSKEEPKSAENNITSFQLNINNSLHEGLINQQTGRITFEFAEELPVSLTPIIKFPSTAFISPSAGSAQNFNNVTRYTVTAENGMEKAYTIVIERSTTATENTLPGAMEFVGVEFNKREFTIDWTDAEDTDPITYHVYKNSVKIGEYEESVATMAFTYNQNEKITIFATDQKGGTSKLEFDIEAPESELIFVTNSSGVMYAIDTKVQDILWVGKSADRFFAPPLNKNQVLTSWDRKLTGLDLLTGEEVQVYDSITSTRYSKYQDIVIDKDFNSVYFKHGDGKIYSVDSNGGGENWATYLGNTFSTHTPTTISESNIYTISGRDDVLFCIDKLSGEIQWQYDLISSSNQGVPSYRRNPIVTGISIFFGGDGRVYSLNKNTGEENWVININNPSSFSQFGEQLIIVALEGIYGINPLNGSIIWSKTTTWGTVSTPFLENETLYMGIIGNGVGSIIAINAKNGDEIWKRDVSGSVSASPVVYGEKLYVCDREGLLYCLNTKDGNLLWQIRIGDYVDTSPTFVKGNGELVVYPKVLGFTK